MYLPLHKKNNKSKLVKAGKRRAKDIGCYAAHITHANAKNIAK